MKAIAKHDIGVTLYFDLNSISLNRMTILRGQEITDPVVNDENLTGKISEILGTRSVTFMYNGMYMPTYSRDFEYIE